MTLNSHQHRAACYSLINDHDWLLGDLVRKGNPTTEGQEARRARSGEVGRRRCIHLKVHNSRESLLEEKKGRNRV